MVIATHLAKTAASVHELWQDREAVAALHRITSRVLDCFSSGGKLLICGNGGSAADAQHIAAEFIGRYKLNRQPLPAMALTTDSSALTAIGNDYGFDAVFSRQVLGIGKPHDLLWVISTSGRSPNVLLAMQAARATGIKVVAFTGGRARDDFRDLADEIFAPKDKPTALLQQLHIIGAHCICDAVEQDLCQ